MQPAKTLTIAFCAIAILCSAAHSQLEQQPKVPTGLSLQISYYKRVPPTYMTVPPEGAREGGAWMPGSRLARLEVS